MKKGVRGVLVMAAFMAMASCSKNDDNGNDASDKDSNCKACESSNTADFDICEKEGKIFIDGTEIPEAKGLSLDKAIDILVNNSEFENLSCK